MSQGSILYASVSMCLKGLTDDELCALDLWSTFGPQGGSAKSKPWYSKVSAIFTEKNGEAMHAETLRMLHIEANRRLSIALENINQDSAAK